MAGSSCTHAKSQDAEVSSVWVVAPSTSSLWPKEKVEGRHQERFEGYIGRRECLV